MFDVNVLNSIVVEDANSTRIIPVPEGEYTATITSLDAKEVSRQDGSKAPVVQVTWQVHAQNLPGSNQVRQDLWLDMTPHGTLDMSEGKNISLGRLREAIGQNKPGMPWSFQKMIGQTARILVTHRTTEDGETFAQVKKVSAL